MPSVHHPSDNDQPLLSKLSHQICISVIQHWEPSTSVPVPICTFQNMFSLVWERDISEKEKHWLVASCPPHSWLGIKLATRALLWLEIYAWDDDPHSTATLTRAICVRFTGMQAYSSEGIMANNPPMNIHVQISLLFLGMIFERWQSQIICLLVGVCKPFCLFNLFIVNFFMFQILTQFIFHDLHRSTNKSVSFPSWYAKSVCMCARACVHARPLTHPHLQLHSLFLFAWLATPYRFNFYLSGVWDSHLLSILFIITCGHQLTFCSFW